MKNNKGFTLIEVIVSIALLGIISVGLISGLSTQFRFLKSTQTFTEDLSAAQQSIEQQISNVKKEIKAGSVPSGGETYTIFDGTLYERNVTGYARQLEVSVGNDTRTLYTVVGDEILEYPVASASVAIEFSSGSTAYEYASSLYATSEVTLDDPDGVNLTNIYRWYVSRSGFNIPAISSPGEVEIGTIYPMFPDDYIIIPGASGTTLSSLMTNYPGRHIICTVTPAATSGKMGATAVSNPLYISGMPVKSDLLLHLDASMISKEDTSAVISDHVKYWYDISGEDCTATQSTSSRRPELCETLIGDIVVDGDWFETYAKYAAFDGGGDVMTAYVGTLPGEITAFVVARNTGAEDFSIYQDVEIPDYISYSWGYLTIGDTADAVDIAEIIIYDTALSEDDVADVRAYLQEKYLPVTPPVTIRSLQPVSVTVFKDEVYTLPATVSAYMSNGKIKDVAVTWSPSTIDTSTAGIKYSTATAVSDTSKTTTLSANVIVKVLVTGVTLDKHALEIEIGSNDLLTATVAPLDAYNRAISWSSSNTSVATVDQNGYVTAISPGSATITVTTQDGGFTDTCSVTVTQINVTGVTLNKSKTTIYKYRSEALVATVSPSNATDKSVVWSSSNTGAVTVDSSGNISSGGTNGTATITVRTVDGDFTAACTVYVVSNKVTGVSLSNSTITLENSETYTLTATVSPATATVKTVTWSSGNTGVATVSSSGLVTAVSAGTATITVKTDDGDFTATCVVTVVGDNTPPTVTKLGTGKSDYSIPARTSRNLVFSEQLSAASKTAVQTALTAGFSRTSLTFSWSGATLTITNTSSSSGKFNSDVRANITDLAGNTTTNALLVDSK